MCVGLRCGSRFTGGLLVQVGGNVHTLCSFTAYALPQLESLGFKIEIAADYPYQVVSPDVPWYATVDAMTAAVTGSASNSASRSRASA